ncbi:MAG: hypothetical protein H7840_17255 [Alphaproteobacteria bacterium]
MSRHEVAKDDACTEARAVVVPGGQDEKVTRRAAIEGALLHRFNPSANKLDGPAGEWRHADACLRHDA